MTQLKTTRHRSNLRRYARVAAGLLLVGAASLTGCRKEDMAQQPKYEPMVPSDFFADGLSARPLVEGTVARNGVVINGYDYDPGAGMQYGGNFPPGFPHEGNDLLQKLERGRQRYTIYCSVCHGDLGNGQGMIVQRGFTRPPAFYPVPADAHLANDPEHILYEREQRLAKEPPGYFYNVATNGYGAMYSYAARVKSDDRWAIAAYIQALQLSQNADFAQLSPEDQAKVDAGKKADAELKQKAAEPAEQSTGEP